MCQYADDFSYTCGLQILLEKGANPDSSDRNHETPAHKAAVSGHAEVVKVTSSSVYDLLHTIVSSTGTHRSWSAYRGEGSLWTNAFARGGESRTKGYRRGQSVRLLPQVDHQMPSRTDVDRSTSPCRGHSGGRVDCIARRSRERTCRNRAGDSTVSRFTNLQMDGVGACYQRGGCECKEQRRTDTTAHRLGVWTAECRESTKPRPLLLSFM